MKGQMSKMMCEDDIRENFNLNFKATEYHKLLQSLFRAKRKYFESTLSFIYDVLKSNRFKGNKLLEIGSGATVHNIASASAYFPIIVQSDFVEDSRKLLKKWLGGESSLDWTEFLNLPAKLEKPEGDLDEVRQKLESRIRSMVKAVVQCDILSDGVLQTEDLTPESSPPYDLIISVLCLEVPCLNFESFVNVLKRLNKLLRKGGGILISSVLDIEDWEVEGKKFPHLKIDLKDILLALDMSGFGNHVVKYMSPKNPLYEELQYEYYCISSEKLH